VVSQRPNVGDIFVIPVGDGRAGVGQVVAKYGNDAYYLAVFDFILPLDEAGSRAAEALAAPIRFLALTLDAKIHVGDWPIVGEGAVGSVPLPAYKEAVTTPHRLDVVDYTGERRRPATAAEALSLRTRKVVAPVRLERALRASLGLEPWHDAFDELRADSAITTAEAFG
jgi:hypothetical protein